MTPRARSRMCLKAKPLRRRQRPDRRFAGKRGRGRRGQHPRHVWRSHLIRFAGDEVTVQAGPEGVRFLLISGAPIEEPVAWSAPS
jgi:redox-sensitive bicupin YhaK (pirin superfamily)